MGIEVIVGPPNSGRAAELRARLEALLEREPVLVVPTIDDAARFERELCERRAGAAVVGVAIRTFAALFDDVARALGVSLPPALGPPQRLALVRAAIRGGELRLLRRSSARRGFAPALDELIAELQAALVSPAELARAASELEGGDYERELAGLYRRYVELRDRAGRGDAGSRAAATVAALRTRPHGWRGRPVLVYGFDDLTRVQLELVAALAGAAEVTVAVNYADRDALAARAGLLAELRDELGGEVAKVLGHDPSHTAHESLRHLDASLFEPDAGRVPLDGGVRMTECAGELGEAEAIGGAIAHLLAAGESPDSIAVVIRDPVRRGPLLGRVLRRLGIPVAVESEAPLALTAVGRSLASLCRALARDDPTELVEHLRADPAAPPGVADVLELRVRRQAPGSIAEAIGGWKAPPRHLAAVGAARSAPERMRALAAIARELAEAPHTGRAPLAGAADGGPGTPFEPVEQRAGLVAAELLEELAEIGGLPGCEPPDLLEAAEAVEAASVRLWRGPAEGRVRVLDPYRIRAGHARHLFVAGLNEGEFPRRAGAAGAALLGDERRARLGIPALVRRDPVDEERYLFHACVSRPTETLHLSWQGADDDGAPAARSPFVDEVLDLLGPDPEAAAGELIARRGPERVTFAPGEAPTPRELARARALAGPRVEEERPGPLRSPEVLAELGGRELLSASTLEAWLECPYRWFVEHELAPERLDPESDALRLGSVAHDALERLYREPPGEDSIPRPGDLPRWRERLGERLEEAARDHGLDAARPADAIALARLRAQIESFLAEESELETELRPRPELLEARFGESGGEDGPAPPPLRIGDAKLRGRIDRVDVGPDGRAALVRDYKTSREVHGRKGWERRGKLQLQLYVLAARERLGLDPVGGLYTALGARDDRRPRGIAVADDPRLGELPMVGGDACEREEFDRELERARELAAEKAAAMRAGGIGRDPIGGRCPSYCSYQPICRLERAVGLDEANGAGNGGGS